MEFRWSAILALWTMVVGPVIAPPPPPQMASPQSQPAHFVRR